MGAVEYIDPGDVWLFKPAGGDPRYEESVLKANEPFLERGAPDRVIEYEVSRPFETLTALHSLLSGALKVSRPVILPFGPKVFTLCSLLVACLRLRDVSVWRISSESYLKPVDRRPTGEVVGLRADFVVPGMLTTA